MGVRDAYGAVKDAVSGAAVWTPHYARARAGRHRHNRTAEDLDAGETLQDALTNTVVRDDDRVFKQFDLDPKPLALGAYRAVHAPLQFLTDIDLADGYLLPGSRQRHDEDCRRDIVEAGMYTPESIYRDDDVTVQAYGHGRSAVDAIYDAIDEEGPAGVRPSVREMAEQIVDMWDAGFAIQDSPANNWRADEDGGFTPDLYIVDGEYHAAEASPLARQSQRITFLTDLKVRLPHAAYREARDELDRVEGFTVSDKEEYLTDQLAPITAAALEKDRDWTRNALENREKPAYGLTDLAADTLGAAAKGRAGKLHDRLRSAV